LLAYTVATRTS
jgi:hypothetical protein